MVRLEYVGERRIITRYMKDKSSIAKVVYRLRDIRFRAPTMEKAAH